MLPLPVLSIEGLVKELYFIYCVLTTELLNGSLCIEPSKAVLNYNQKRLIILHTSIFRTFINIPYVSSFISLIIFDDIQ